MRRGGVLALVVALGLPAASAPQEAGGPQATVIPEPGRTPVGDLIFARRVLMGGIDIYMQEIEAFVLDAETKGIPIPFEGAEAADIVSTMLIAFPHLFKPGSDIWSEEAEAADPTAVSLALPTVWENFPDFYRRANKASQMAFDLSRQNPRDESWIAAARELRATCVSCHAEYTRLITLDQLEPPLPVQD